MRYISANHTESGATFHNAIAKIVVTEIHGERVDEPHRAAFRRGKTSIVSWCRQYKKMYCTHRRKSLHIWRTTSSSSDLATRKTILGDDTYASALMEQSPNNVSLSGPGTDRSIIVLGTTRNDCCNDIVHTVPSNLQPWERRQNLQSMSQLKVKTVGMSLHCLGRCSDL